MVGIERHQGCIPEHDDGKEVDHQWRCAKKFSLRFGHKEEPACGREQGVCIKDVAQIGLIGLYIHLFSPFSAHCTDRELPPTQLPFAASYGS